MDGEDQKVDNQAPAAEEQPPQQEAPVTDAVEGAADDAPVADMEGGMDGAMDGDMDGDMAGMDDMDGMDGDMDAMDGDMDMDGDAPVLGEDGEELPAEDEEEAKASDDANQDFSKDPRIQWMLKYVEEIMNYKADEESTAPTNERLSQFHAFLEKTDYDKFFVWVEFENPELRWSFERAPHYYEATPKPAVQDYQIAFFIKRNPTEKITMKNIDKNVMTGLCNGDPLDQLLTMMNDACPKLLGESDWPDNVKKEFTSNLHNFMAFITEASYVAKGMQNLYIPNEDLSDMDTAKKDKELMQRLETIVIYWTRQIKELVSNQDSSQSSHDNSSPLDEIKHWTDRSANLKVLTQRLVDPKLIRIIEVLKLHQSSYLQTFLDLKDQIQTSYEEATNNRDFLKILEDPCRKIEKAQPANIPALIPDVLDSVRVVWELSDNYATTDRMKGLLTKISNQINQRCRNKIDKEDMLGRDVEKCMRDLDESVECCKQWKEICTKIQKRIIKHSNRSGWEEDDGIFAENEAFIQRCRDLKEICEGQLQFAQRGESCVMPIFGGSRRTDLSHSLDGLRVMFDKNLDSIKQLDYDILDVKITRWHDDYGQLFKDHVKTIEIIYTTIITNSFQYVATIEDAVEMLENWYQLAKRPTIIDHVFKKAAELVYQLFIAEVKEVEDTFESSYKKRPYMPLSHPHHAGMAIWINSLICRIDRAKLAIDGMYFIRNHPSTEEAEAKYEKLKESLDAYILNSIFQEWSAPLEHIYLDNDNIEHGLSRFILIKTTQELLDSQPAFLNKNLLFAKSRKPGLLESNFDPNLRKMLIEVKYWTKVAQHGFVNLHINLTKLHNRREPLRILQENVMLIVRDYNHIMNLIDDKERKLFAEHLAQLDGNISNGIRRLQWINNADAFVHTCRGSCRDTLRKIKAYQDNDSKIRDEFDKLSSTVLTNIVKQLYSLPLFNDTQDKELALKKEFYKSSFDKIRKLLAKTYSDLFMDHGQSIQREWLSTMRELDQSLMKALRSSVKATLLDFQHHIKGDQQEVVPIFTIVTELDTTQDEWKVIHQPNHAVLKQSIEALLVEVVRATKVVPRIEGVFRKDRQAILDGYYEKIQEVDRNGTSQGVPPQIMAIMTKVYGNNFSNMTNEEQQRAWDKQFLLPNIKSSDYEYYDKVRSSKDIEALKEQIKGIVDAIQQKMDEDCKMWQVSNEIRHLSSLRTHRGQMRFLKGAQGGADDAVAKYKNGIEALKEIVEEVSHNRPSTRNEQFIVFHAQDLKRNLMDQGHASIAQIFGNLIQESKKELQEFLAELRDTVDELTQVCTSKEQFKRNQDKLTEVNNRKGELQGKIEPIKKKFEFIMDDNYSDIITGNFELTDKDKDDLASLDQAWKTFLLGMNEAKDVIRKCLLDFKSTMEDQIEEYKREVESNKKDFNEKAPFLVTPEFEAEFNKKAFESIQRFQIDCKRLRDDEEGMQFGLDIFNIERTQYTDLSFVETKNESLLKIWTIKQEYDHLMDQWNNVGFYEIDLKALNDAAEEISFKAAALTTEEQKWKVSQTLHEKIHTLLGHNEPLTKLRDESMRERHWKELRIEVKEDFDENSPEFTFAKVYSLNLLDHEEKIEEIAKHARDQLKIEKSLAEIEDMWEHQPSTNLEIEVSHTKGSSDMCYKITGTEKLVETIENHSTDLAKHKSSPFYKQFDDKIDMWENNIARITETLELLMIVQDRWSYLESIFGGQVHIQKSLPQEYTIFKQVDTQFRTEMKRLHETKNAYRGLVEDARDFINILNQLNTYLEVIQKKLNDLLAAKRGMFPRFYFLSNEDLLEIIGQAKNPEAINKHIKKIYEGINKIRCEQTQSSKNQKEYVITHVIAEDGETMAVQEVSASQPLELTTSVEAWMANLTQASMQALQKGFYEYMGKVPSTQGKRPPDKDRMSQLIGDNLGQILLTYNQIEWTANVRAALANYSPEIAASNSNPLKKLRNMYKKKIETYIQVVDNPKLLPMNRNKVEAMIIMEEHNRDVIDKLFQNKQIHSQHFEWLSQLRYDKDTEGGSETMSITVEQLNFSREYGYEYQGNNGRLVVTGLTDKAYMTLTNALQLFKGGAPQGPAGTGKTETTKDLGKNLAIFVNIQNCSDQMDHNSLGTNFCGLAQEGAWGCFDEFNRITLDVLSVITTMIKDILDSIKKTNSAVTIGDASFIAKPNTGLFITMNPGYAGRTELPDNLASLFRPVAMMVPDFFAIAKNILMSKGFQKNEELSKKICTVYDLMQRQLSRQDFYDFSTRAVKSCVLACGNIKRKEPNQDEVKIVLKAIRDMNLPKLVFEDVALFDNLFMDLFPEIEEPEIDNDALQIAIEQTMIEKGLQLDENIVVKCLQLNECKNTRHGNMLIGSTMSGKTVCWQILAEALNRLHKEEKEEKGFKDTDKNAVYNQMQVKVEALNPKSINVDELYGAFDDQAPPQWCDGVLSSVLKQMVSLEQNALRWMVIDGPVDTLWIESMNSVLDDSKRLTLVNCDVIALTKNVRLLFEVDGLAVASPATVSRVGMVYMDIDELGWKPICRSWLETKNERGKAFKTFLSETVFRYLDKVLTAKKANCTELVPSSPTACVRNMAKLFDSLEDQWSDKSKEMPVDDFHAYVEKWFVFSMIWSIGATVDEQSRRELDIVIRDVEPMFPTTNTVFDYYINLKKCDWAPWDEMLKTQILQGKEFHDIYIQTIDWARNRFVSQALLKHDAHILFVGNSGVGKTVLIEKTLLAELNELELSFTINFSAGSDSKRTQEVIESNFDRRAKNKFKPRNTKLKAVCFIDDLNMPLQEEFGAQPPIELIRQWFDSGFWYDRKKIVKNYMCDLQFLAAMGKPGGGRAILSPRMVSKFHLINFTNPSEKQMRKIYETIFITKFYQFGDDIKFLQDSLAIATINIFNQVSQDFLPTPKKTHYIYNMRDISKVFQGLFLADKVYYESKEQIVKLWGHEVLRVFHDRLISFEDREKFKKMVNDQLEAQMQMNYTEHCLTNQESDAVFVDFLVEDEETKVYEEVEDFNQLRTFLNEKLVDYNKQKKVQVMDIVLFTDAIIHVSRIYRVLNMKRGHALLVGVGGSGRHSLTRLSAFISNMNVDQLEIKKDFGLKDFRQKLMDLYELAAYRGFRAGKGGSEKLKTVFIFSDTDVVDETFLEDIQNMLNAGIVPNIYPAEELPRIQEEMKSCYKLFCQKNGVPFNETPEIMNQWFYNRVKDHMHLSICMSPIGERFRSYTRNYPALINSTAIDWFMAWPEEALIEVARKYISRIDIEEQFKEPLAIQCGYSFNQATEFALRMDSELRRIFYVTPTNFIELLKGYEKILKSKRKEIGTQSTKLRSGLDKLASAAAQVADMTAESEIKRAEVSKKQQECQDLKIDLDRQEKDANEKQKGIEVKTEYVEKERIRAQALADDANADLEKTMPILEAANEAVNNLTKKDIGEVRAYAQPPKDIQNVMSAVMTVLGKPNADWAAVKKEMADMKFMERIINLDKNNMPESTMKKIEAYTKKDNFLPQILMQKSIVAGALCSWVKAVEEYHKALKVVRPKIAKKEAAEALLKELEASLKEMTDAFAILSEKLAALQASLKKNTDEMEAYKADLDSLQAKIERGDKLITGLADEKVRWEASADTLEEQYDKLIGDAALGSAFMSLCGPFPADFRVEMSALWKKRVQQLELPHDEDYEFCEFLGSKPAIKKWQQDGLPIDTFSTENGVCITKGDRWALSIDPQTQANSWIKKMQGRNLVLLDPNDNKLLQKIGKCVSSGKTILLEDVGENLDPSLDNLLNKAYYKAGGELLVKIGENEITYNPKFTMFITTRISNPHYTPEVSTKVNVINFTIKEQGLEEQCLGIVVQEEQPALEASKNAMIDKIENGTNTLKKLEDEILTKLQESKVSLLENVALIQTLQTAKETQENVAQGLESSANAMKKMNETRDSFRPAGQIAAALFFVLLDLYKINPMYQFSLEWYRGIFKKSINDAKANAGPNQDKIEQIKKCHIRNVYQYTCRSLFERHKLLLAFQLTIKMRMLDGAIDPDEYLFFLRGAVGLADKSLALPKPNADWVQETAWNHLVELDQMVPAFTGITQAINLSTKEWKNWFSSKKPEPEEYQLPGEWETKCEEPLRKLIVLRCFRPDRVNFAVRNYILQTLKSQEFITTKSTRIEEIFSDSSPSVPILIVLTQGVDPTDMIDKYAAEQQIEINYISLGKGQTQKAIKYLQSGAEEGHWCFLQNCHLSVNMLPELEAKLDELVQMGCQENFRLFMSANPTDKFPISLLQRSVKMTVEPPRNIKPNMQRLYRNIGQSFTYVDKEQAFRKAIFGLCWFHTLLIERKKFKSLGWNSNYPFNDSDWQVCADTLANYMGRLKDGVAIDSYNKKQPIPWQAIQYLVSKANYGGRVTDDQDMRVINVYCNEIFNEDLIAPEKWRPGPDVDQRYTYPADEINLKSPADQAAVFHPEWFAMAITEQFPNEDLPEAYGQHTNAEINSQTIDSEELLVAILSLQPQIATGGGSAEDKSLAEIQNIRTSIPDELISLPNLKHKLAKDGDPLNIVLVQEVSRYNNLLLTIKKTLRQLELGIMGLDLITPDLEKMMAQFSTNIVPDKWNFAYFSLKPLSNWKEDLSKRYEFFREWVTNGSPTCFWIGAFTFPTGFTTSLLQRFSRKKDSPPIDRLEFDFIPQQAKAAEFISGPKEGAYIYGLYLEGGNWDEEKSVLCEPEIMELVVQMPVIHMKPIQKRVKAPQNIYECPCYYYPVRKGTVERDSYMMKVDLKLGEAPQDHWIKRGTALLMSTAV